MANAPYYAEGDYQAIISSHTFTPGQYGVQLVIGIEPQVEGKMYPRTIYLPFLDTEDNPDKNIERTIASLNAIGYSDNPSRLDQQSDNPVSLVGNEIAVVCLYNKEGKERWYIKTEREAREPVAKQTLRKLDALFGKSLKQSSSKQPEKASQNQSYTAPAREALAGAQKPKPQDAGIAEANRQLDEMLDAPVNDDIPF